MSDQSPLEAVFFAALEKGSPEERAAYLDQVSAGNPDLRRRIEKMLAAQAQAGSFLEQPVLTLLDTLDEPISEHPGTVIGPYKLLEQIGEGGFGIVFMAEQTRPVRRKVALKILKPGMDTRQVVARFEAERQALALMDHPHIARVFDGGETATGRPYFVMELVKGVPLTEFCDHHQLTPRQRLELFVSLCQAVQHAHQKGIIHRDLKPSNVLVTLHDTTPVVKVIDFGVAKALGQELTDKTLFTGFAQMIGTPLYMSPEQAGQSGLDVDTRSDIYSLGVILYELLTGTTPFDKTRLKGTGYDEIRRVIREEEPPRPSTRISTLGQAASTIAAKRGTDVQQLNRLVRGELDWIVMKALEKDRNRRYETASAFAADVQRYLNDEPVLACPPSACYRLGKFVRRNRGKVAATVVLFLSLLAGVVGTSLGLIEARRQRDAARDAQARAYRERHEARKQQNIAKKSLAALYDVAATQDPLEALFPKQLGGPIGGDVTSRALAAARGEMAKELHDQPRERARLNVVIGNVLRSRGELREAINVLNGAVQTLATSDEATAEEQANAHYFLGWAQHDIGDLRDAEASFRTCLKLLSGRKDVAPELLADVYFQFGWALSDRAVACAQDRKLKLKAQAAEAMNTAKAFYGKVPGAELKMTLCELAVLLINPQQKTPNPLELIPLLAKLPHRHEIPRVLLAVTMGEKARRQRNHAEAIRQLTVVDETARRILGPTHPLRGLALGLLAEVHAEGGDFVTAERLIREALDIGRQAWPHRPIMVEALRELAKYRFEAGNDPAEAMKLLNEAERIANRHGDDLDHLRPGLASLRERAEQALKKAPNK